MRVQRRRTDQAAEIGRQRADGRRHDGRPGMRCASAHGIGSTAVERTHVVSAPAHLVGHTAPVEVGLLVVGLWHLHIIILTAVVGTLCLQEAQARGERR